MPARSAVSRPSASQPAQYSMRIGWRLGWMQQRSPRGESVHFTGRCSSQAASAVCAWLAMSSLPPNAPPLDTSSTVTRPRLDAEHRGDLVAVVPHPLPAGVHVHGRLPSASGTASVDSGSRKACSMRWVWNTSCDDVCAGRERGVDVAPLVRGHRQHVAVGAPHRDLGVVEGRDRVGERPQHVVVDVDELGRRPRLLAGLGHDDREHVAGVGRAAALGDEHRPVLVDEPDPQLAGTSAAVNTATTPARPAAPMSISMRRTSARAWSVEAEGGVQHPGHPDVVDVAAVAERQLARLVLGAAGADAAGRRRAASSLPAASDSMASRIFT